MTDNPGWEGILKRYPWRTKEELQEQWKNGNPDT